MTPRFNGLHIRPAGARRTANAQHRRGFSLIEMLVVIGIIVLLASLTLAISVAVRTGSEVDQTRTTLTQVESALREWQTTSERQLSYGTNDDPFNGAVYDIQEDLLPLPPDDGDNALLTRLVLTRLRKATASAEILKNIDTDLLQNDPNPPAAPVTWPRERLVDAWDHEIIVVFPGRKVHSSDPSSILRDKDGTVRTPYENAFGVCPNGTIVFVSAGPDGKFGNLHLDTATGSLGQSDLADIEFAGDNVYSSPLLQERP
jgi:prepilin-type N-terminal cleavage/methylation domain-containing protein